MEPDTRFKYDNTFQHVQQHMEGLPAKMPYPNESSNNLALTKCHNIYCSYDCALRHQNDLFCYGLFCKEYNNFSYDHNKYVI